MGYLSHTYKRLKRCIAKHGVSGTLKLIATNLAESAKQVWPAHRRQLMSHQQTERNFDAQYGVDTAGDIPLTDLHIDSDNQLYGSQYEPIHPIDFATLLQDYHVPYRDTLFIDYGSGKGRAVLLAAALPFKKIIGVEFSPELNRIAKRNLAHYSGSQRCKRIELLCRDATDYVLPNEPLVLFFYNPFERPVMQTVVEHIARSYQDHPRSIIAIYFTPDYADIWAKQAFWAGQSFADDDVIIYTTREARARRRRTLSLIP